MKKIRLTVYDEYLVPYSGHSMANSGKDDCELLSCIGVHETCNGWIDRVVVSETHWALHCRRCNLRMVIPLEVSTWKKLESHMLNVVTDGYLKEEQENSNNG